MHHFRILFSVIFLFIISGHAFSQRLTNAELKAFSIREDSLKKLSYDIVRGSDAAVRFRSDSTFTKILVRTLLMKNSFYYPLDSLAPISRIYAPDSNFRIFTWQVSKDDNYCRQKGCIQMRTADGSLKLFPLRDVSEFTNSITDTIANPGGWIGAIYYRIILKEFQGKKTYTLLGYDENNAYTTRKWIEILEFDRQNNPVFGKYKGFSYEEDKPVKPGLNRFLLEYKKDGRARVQYDEEMDMIIFDHLISESNEPEKKYTLIPDGDYEGFKWKEGRWIHVDKVFDFKLNDGEAPVPHPFNEKKLPDGGF
jgi:hypothetical protein